MNYTDITKLENCPECGANWVEAPIPEKYWENYSPPYFYSRVVLVLIAYALGAANVLLIQHFYRK
jgi:hypothetical protein